MKFIPIKKEEKVTITIRISPDLLSDLDAVVSYWKDKAGAFAKVDRSAVLRQFIKAGTVAAQRDMR